VAGVRDTEKERDKLLLSGNGGHHMQVGLTQEVDCPLHVCSETVMLHSHIFALNNIPLELLNV